MPVRHCGSTRPNACKEKAILKTLIRRIAAVATAALFCMNLYFELAPKYAIGPTWKFGFAAVFAGLLALAFFCGVTPGQKQKRMHDYVLILFWYYIWVLMNVLFFDSTFGRGFSLDLSFGAVNLVPFRTIHDYLAAYGYGNISLYLVVLNLAGNLVAFAPMGFFLPALFRWQRSIFFFTATLTLAITAVEVSQVYSGTGSCDVDDLILNLAGALVVYIFCRIPPLWRNVCRITPKKGD